MRPQASLFLLVLQLSAISFTYAESQSLVTQEDSLRVLRASSFESQQYAAAGSMARRGKRWNTENLSPPARPGERGSSSLLSRGAKYEMEDIVEAWMLWKGPSGSFQSLSRMDKFASSQFLTFRSGSETIHVTLWAPPVADAPFVLEVSFVSTAPSILRDLNSKRPEAMLDMIASTSGAKDGAIGLGELSCGRVNAYIVESMAQDGSGDNMWIDIMCEQSNTNTRKTRLCYTFDSIDPSFPSVVTMSHLNEDGEDAEDLRMEIDRFSWEGAVNIKTVAREHVETLFAHVNVAPSVTMRDTRDGEVVLIVPLAEALQITKAHIDNPEVKTRKSTTHSQRRVEPISKGLLNPDGLSFTVEESEGKSRIKFDRPIDGEELKRFLNGVSSATDRSGS